MKYCVLSLVLALVAQPLLADNSSTNKPSERKVAQAGKEKPGKSKPSQGDAAEADVLEFVREHHPELADLLSQLKENHPKEYQKAVQDLSRVRQRLHAMKKNDNSRYDLELAVWKAETRVQLLAARLQMGSTTELREQLRAALNEQMDLRLTVLKHERDQAKDRIGKLDAQIKKLDNERSETVDRQLQALTAKQGVKEGEKPSKPKVESKPPVKPVKEPAKKT